ncbi:MAG: rod shape-determining protein MreD [Actinobacteria bacterium]|nr:MAG: rod shape-determining protein MreD [Actinomycetota bacterium]
MRRALPATLAILAAAALQVGIAPHVGIGGVVPNLLLLVVITLAFMEGSQAGMVAGFSAGLLLDLLGTGPVGAWALVLAVTGYVTGLVAANLFAEGWLLPVTVAAVACLLAEGAYAFELTMFGEGANLAGALLTKVLPGAVYNAALALLVYPWLARAMRREPRLTELRRIG